MSNAWRRHVVVATMAGSLTTLFATPHFTRRNDAAWRVLQTYTNCEKAVQTHLDKVGVENYLPRITVHAGAGSRAHREIQLANVIFARYDVREHPGLCSNRNKLYPDTPARGTREESILATMESCWRLETLSARYPVENVCSATPPGEPCQLKGGPLSGSCGYRAVEDGHHVFYLPLPEDGRYARMDFTHNLFSAK